MINSELKTLLNGRLLKPLHTKSSAFKILKKLICAVLRDSGGNRLPEYSSLNVALLWSMQAKCETLVSGSAGYVVMDGALIELFALLVNGLFVDPPDNRSFVRVFVLSIYSCILNYEFGKAQIIIDRMPGELLSEVSVDGDDVIVQSVIYFLLYHEIYHYAMRQSPEFHDYALSYYREEVVPISAGFLNWPPFSIMYPKVDKNLSAADYAKLLQMERDRTKQNIFWINERTEEEICDYWALFELNKRFPDHTEIVLSTPIFVALLLSLRDDLFSVATFTQSAHMRDYTITVAGERNEKSSNMIHEARVKNAVMRTRAFATLMDLEHHLDGAMNITNEFQDGRYSFLKGEAEQCKRVFNNNDNIPQMARSDINLIYDALGFNPAKSCNDFVVF